MGITRVNLSTCESRKQVGVIENNSLMHVYDHEMVSEQFQNKLPFN